MSVYTPKFQNALELRNFLILERRESGLSFDKHGKKYGVNGGTIFQIITKGHEPTLHRIRMALGLPLSAMVRPVDGEIIPDGTQVRKVKICQCGEPFAPNAGNRKKCFDCSVYKGK